MCNMIKTSVDLHVRYSVCLVYSLVHGSLLVFQEAKLLRDAIFPSLLCSAARQGNIDMLKELREVVSNLVNDRHLKC